MRTTLLISVLTVFLAGCGAHKTPTAAAPKPAATVKDELAGYSAGVRDYYGGEHPHTDGDPNAEIEAEYHQPPKPAEAGAGGTITMTGTNIGVRFEVTVTGVHTVRARGNRYTAVDVVLESTGITIYEGELRQAELTYADGKPRQVAQGAAASCSNDLDAHVRIDVGASKRGCLLFPAQGDERPARLQLALETVPTQAGGIWNLGA
jgi:hypothetical protein